VSDVLIVGAGAAGVSAAIALASRVSGVRVLTAGSGASSLFGGTLDVTPWQKHGAPAWLEGDLQATLDRLELYRLPEKGALVATTAGILRPARGIDRALLDLRELSRGNVLVPRADHHAWDANALARSLADSAEARAQNLAFTAVDATITRFRDERPLANAEIAARHDDPQRLSWLADRLRETLARAGTVAAVLLPPWLGIDRPRAEALSERVGVPCGEASSALASSAGLRFERARDRTFATMGVEARRAWVERIRSTGTPERPAFAIETDEGETHLASLVLLATGGLVGGGLAYDPGEARAPFRTAIEVECTVGAHQRPLDRPGSLSGAPPESLAWPFTDDPLLERAGVLVGPGFAVKDAPRGLYACGDLIADRPRTWLEAWSSGVSFADGVLVGAQKLVPDLEGEVLALRGVGR